MYGNAFGVNISLDKFKLITGIVIHHYLILISMLGAASTDTLVLSSGL